MSRREPSRHKSSHKGKVKGNANEIPLGTRKRIPDKDKRDGERKLLPHLNHSGTKPPNDSIGNSLRQIRRQASQDAPLEDPERRSHRGLANGLGGDVNPSTKKPSIKDRLGTAPVRGRDDSFRPENTHNTDQQYFGRGHRGGPSHFPRNRGAHSMGGNATPYRGFRGRGGTRGRGRNAGWNQGLHAMEGAFPDRNLEIGEAYPMPETPL